MSRCLAVGKEARFTNTIESWMVCYFVSTGVGLQGFLTGSLIPSHRHPPPAPFRLECLLFVCREMEGILKRKPSKFWEDQVSASVPLVMVGERRGREKWGLAPSARLMVASVPVLTPYSTEH